MGKQASPPPALDDPRRCQATGKRSGERCHNWAIQGATVCRMHGGGAKQVRAAAKRRLAEQAVMRTLTEMEIEPLGDPIEAMIGMAEEAQAMRKLLIERIAYWEKHYQASEELKDAGWRKWFEALDKATTLCKALAGLDLEGRRVRLAERQGQLFSDVLRRVFDDPELGLSQEQRKAAGQVAGRHLRLVQEATG